MIPKTVSPSPLTLVLVALTTIVLVIVAIAAVVAGFLFINFSTIGDTATEDPADYPAMRASLLTRYPKAPDFLPQTIPAQAEHVRFAAHMEEFLQASPMLELSYTLPDEPMTLELKRLNTFGNLRLGTSGQLDLSDSPDLIAMVHYDAEDGEIRYQLWKHD